MLVVLLGGARSGKSALASVLARDEAAPVTFIATAVANDAEFARRIDAHRALRPASWLTIEEPLELNGALQRTDRARTVIVDCLTLWVANLLERGLDEERIVGSAASFAHEAERRPGLVIAVSNEVGSGIVPSHPLSRHFRDVLGRVNAVVSLAAGEAYLVVAGRMLALGHPSTSRSGSCR